MRKKRKKILLVTVIGILAVTILGFFKIFNPLPKKVVREEDGKARYIIDVSSNSFPKQGRNQCSAFSSAFILRQLGHDVTGEEVYNKIEGKIPIKPWKGYVFYTGIIKIFKDYGYDMKVYVGDLNNLRFSLNKGNPIIVLIGNGFKWQHYITLIGYDIELKEYYFYDSNKREDCNGSDPGNRTIKEDQFLRLWNNKSFMFNKSYFVISEGDR